MPTTNDSKVLRGFRQPRESAEAWGARPDRSFLTRTGSAFGGASRVQPPSWRHPGNGKESRRFPPARATRWPSIARDNFPRSNTGKCCCRNLGSASHRHNYRHATDETNASRRQRRQPVAIQGISMPKFRSIQGSGSGYSQVIQIRGTRGEDKKHGIQALLTRMQDAHGKHLKTVRQNIVSRNPAWEYLFSLEVIPRATGMKKKGKFFIGIHPVFSFAGRAS